MTTQLKPVPRPIWIESNTRCPRLTAAMILSGSAGQLKGFGSDALCSPRKRLRPTLKTAVLLILVAVVFWGAFRLADVERQRYAMQSGLCGGEPPASLPTAACLISAQPRTSWWWNLFYGVSG